MNVTNEMREALAESIKAAGGQGAFAQKLSGPDRVVSQQLVSYWGKRGFMPAEFVVRAEVLTGVARERLRPDVFCIPDDLRAKVA